MSNFSLPKISSNAIINSVVRVASILLWIVEVVPGRADQWHLSSLAGAFFAITAIVFSNYQLKKHERRCFHHE